MGKLVEVMDGTKEGWKKIDMKKKIIMIVVIMAIIFSAIVLTVFSNKGNYVTLFSNLELKDAGRIVGDLEAKKIDYKLEDGGKVILIDEKLAGKYRLELAMEGMLPDSSTGFEIFDDMGLMVTDEDRKIMHQRALTGELQRSIMSLDPINSAKVNLVMAEKSIFETQEKEATASVIVELNPEHKITNDMIRGIVALMSGAVENLPEKNIQVIDIKGNLLSKGLHQDDDVNAMEIVQQYQKFQEQFEEKMESSLRDLLGSAYGQDKIKVSVYADLDFDAEETTVITYDDPVTRSEQISATGTDINIQQVTGGNIDDNISNVVDSTTGEGASYNRTVNNEISNATRNTIKAPGKLNRLTTSVIYDGNLTDRDATKIENIVASATGFDINRGDRISVEGVVFDRTYEEELAKELEAIRLAEEEGLGLFARYGEYAIFAGLGLLGVIILMSIVQVSLKRRKQKRNLIREEELNMYGEQVDVIRAIDELDNKIEVPVDSNEEKAKKYAKENPDIAADLIKAWIKD